MCNVYLFISLCLTYFLDIKFHIMFLSTGVQRFKGKCPQYYKYRLQIELTRGLVQLVSMDGLKWKRNVVDHVTRVASSASLVTCRVMLYSRSPLSLWLVGVTGDQWITLVFSALHFLFSLGRVQTSQRLSN